MNFEIPKESNPGYVCEVTLGATGDQGGTRTHTVKIGGSSSLPFHFFEGRHPHPPRIAMEVFDKKPEKYPEILSEFFGDSIHRPGDMARKCVEEYGAELISIRLEGTHPEKGDKSAEEAAETVRQVLDSVGVPVIVTGHGHYEKINAVMKKVCEVTSGENCLINYVEKDNYKTIAAACLAYGHTLVAQSPIDVNLAKQLNILLTEMHFPKEKIVIDPLTGALGYGLEYTYSIMERIRIDALTGDDMVAFPMLVNPGYESFRVKEARAAEEDYPDWGDLSVRGAYWETATAMSLLVAGADILLLYHPRTVRTVKNLIAEMFPQKEGV